MSKFAKAKDSEAALWVTDFTEALEYAHIPAGGITLSSSLEPTDYQYLLTYCSGVADFVVVTLGSAETIDQPIAASGGIGGTKGMPILKGQTAALSIFSSGSINVAPNTGTGFVILFRSRKF